MFESNCAGSVRAGNGRIIPADYGKTMAFEPICVSVLNGDTIEVLHNQHPERLHIQSSSSDGRGFLEGGRKRELLRSGRSSRRIICVWTS
jgi:hypothetical protein